MVFRIKLADILIEIHSISDKIYSLCKEYICDDQGFPLITVSINEKEINKANDDAQINATNLNNGMYRYFNPTMLESSLILRKVADAIIKFDAFMMHGAVVAVDGWSYMFVAPSGTGKTTRAQLWLKEIPGSFVVNGDKPFLRVQEDCIFTYGTPWSGKEDWNSNVKVPLKAIFLLERSETDVISKLTLSEAMPKLLEQVYWPSDINSIQKTISLLKDIEKSVQIYQFRSTLLNSGIRLAWETAKNN